MSHCEADHRDGGVCQRELRSGGDCPGSNNHAATTETVRLTGWMSFEDGATSIRALLFGAMVDRALPVVQHYRSDLFHDAQWITENVNGPTTFDYVVRESGTNIGDSARIAVKIGAGETAKFYRVELVEERGLWSAKFTDVPLSQVADLP